jgi:aminomethyltransferase
MAAGRPHQIRPTGPSDIRRIEAGILNWGADITLDNNPYEVGLERLVDEGKGADFIGRRALQEIKTAGAQRKLVGIEIAGGALDLNMTKWPVKAEGEVAGHVTSAVFSPRLSKNIGYALVPAAHAGLGTKLAVVLPGGEERPARVVARPFVDPKKAIPKGEPQ